MIKLNKPKNETLVVVAMSGGVDSSVVAAMLHYEGYKVIGITLQLYDHGILPKKIGSCCAGQDIYDAKMVAAKLGIPHYVFDYENEFKTSVIDDFVDSYAKGLTPLPCVKCNQTVKFRDLLATTKNLGADALATGHYIRRIEKNGIPELYQGLDQNKDQSYFLFAITKEQLKYLHFPLGELTKDQTRALAQKYDLLVSSKPDSQDICFVPNGDYASLVKKLKPELDEKGKILHIDGYDMGQHNGIIHFTIGQRKGLGISSTEALYVIKIDPINKIVYVGPKTALDAVEFIIKDVNWLGTDKQLTQDVKVKIRSTHEGAMANIVMINKSQMRIKLFNPQRSITPGQACVIYDNNQLLGGGWITETTS